MRTRNKARKRVDKNKARREKIMNIWKKKKTRPALREIVITFVE